MSPPTKAHQIEPASCVGKYDAQGVAEGKINIPHGYVAEDKKDDLRYLLQIYPNGSKKNYLTSRRISKETGKYVEKQDWCPVVRDHKFTVSLADTIFDGGWHGEGISSDVVHQMRQGEGAYCAFDILFYRGRDMRDETQTTRSALMREIVRQLGLSWMTYNEQIPDHKIRAALQAALKAGKEGLVMKDPLSKYGRGWYKVKRKETFDVIIIGYHAPDSVIYAAKGWIGQIEMGQMLPNGKIVSLGYVKNMTDALRAKISAFKNSYLNTVLEISAQERLKSGKFRNPSVIMPRPDKSPALCRFNPAVEA